MKLLVVESPSKAKTIEKYLDDPSIKLSDKYTVRASVGHVRDLPKSNKKAIDIPGGFIPHYEISKGKEKDRQAKLFLDLSPEEKKVYDLLREPSARDDLIRAMKMPTPTANALISIMEIKGIIKEEIGEIRLV